MDAHTLLILMLMFAAGLVLGAFYFISLWQTLNRLPQSRHQAGLLIASFVLRIAVVLLALYILMDGRWERAALFMVGFIIMRKILTYRLGPQNVAEAVSK